MFHRYIVLLSLVLGVAGQVETPTCIPGALLDNNIQNWKEDQQIETDNMERLCNKRVEQLFNALIGNHGPPIELEIKTAGCFGECQQFRDNIDSLLLGTGCTCQELDTYLPLADLGIDMDSWCNRRPTTFLADVFDLQYEWDAFDFRYCQCTIDIACNTATNLPQLLLVIPFIYAFN